MHKTSKIITLVLTITAIFTGCSSPTVNDTNSQTTINEESIIETEPITETEPFIETEPITETEPFIETEPFTDEEVEVIAKTLAGECYDDKLNDKRLVVEVILNRVSDGRFGESVIEVVSAKGQFNGYWKQNRPVSDSDIRIAKETLREWYENDCKKLSEYLYFCAGPNKENVFRTKY
jgi:spore germination cell wall hydrolase CwlJ-like protein